MRIHTRPGKTPRKTDASSTWIAGTKADAARTRIAPAKRAPETDTCVLVYGHGSRARTCTWYTERLDDRETRAMSDYKQVRMGVTERQLDDMRFIKEVYRLPNEASAVGTALAVTRAIAERVKRQHGRLVLHNDDGTRQEIRIPAGT